METISNKHQQSYCKLDIKRLIIPTDVIINLTQTRCEVIELELHIKNKIVFL